MLLDQEDYGSTETQEYSRLSESAESQDLSRSVWDEFKGSATELFTSGKDKVGKPSESITIEIKDEGLYSSVFDATPPRCGTQPSLGERQSAASGADGRDGGKDMPTGKTSEKPADKVNENSAGKSGEKQVDRAACEAATDAIDKACNQALERIRAAPRQPVRVQQACRRRPQPDRSAQDTGPSLRRKDRPHRRSSHACAGARPLLR